MSATSIIAKVRIAGGEIGLADARIRLKVSPSLRDDVIAEIKAHREAVILALKRENDEPWGADDYRAFYEERAAIAEYDGGQSRAEAEATAYECLIVEWLDLHPELSQPGLCTWCGWAEEKDNPVIPHGIRAHLHTWLPAGCWEKGHGKRQGGKRSPQRSTKPWRLGGASVRLRSHPSLRYLCVRIAG